MSPKQFLGKDMEQALRAVRTALGADALILQTRIVQGPDGDGVEVTAMGEEKIPSSLLVARAQVEEKSERRPQDDVRRDVAALRSMLCWLVPGMGRNRFLERLVAQGLSPEALTCLAQEMELSEATHERAKISQALSRLIPGGGQIGNAKDKQERIALIGPAGVGKTSSLVKLTVLLAREKDLRVGWVEVQSDRIAGNGQLAAYAGVLGVFHEIVADARAMAAALERLHGCDVILFDTPGANPRDAKAVRELSQWMLAVPNLRRMLLLNAVTNSRDMSDWVKIYERVEFDSLLFTKVDECRYFGPLLNTVLTCSRPLSYLAAGQDLVKDLEAARPETITNLILSGADADDAVA